LRNLAAADRDGLAAGFALVARTMSKNLRLDGSEALKLAGAMWACFHATSRCSRWIFVTSRAIASACAVTLSPSAILEMIS
jgi:hypothetical protein